jgi:hypothetical protein
MSSQNEMGLKNFLFKKLDPSLRAQMQLDKEAFYSVTDQRVADKISNFLLELVPASSTITDGTSCVGGNVMSFSKVFHSVNAVERDATRFQMLKNNCALVKCANVNFFKDDYMQMAGTLKQDLIFMDPPWGGPDYKHLTSVELELSGTPMPEVCEQLSRYARYIVLKLPENFNHEGLTERVTAKVTKYSNFRSLMLLVLDFGVGVGSGNGGSEGGSGEGGGDGGGGGGGGGGGEGGVGGGGFISGGGGGSAGVDKKRGLDAHDGHDGDSAGGEGDAGLGGAKRAKQQAD